VKAVNAMPTVPTYIAVRVTEELLADEDPQNLFFIRGLIAYQI